jgi:hypothetical protein
MDTLNHYRSLILSYVEELARYRPSHGDINTKVVLDESHDEYLLLHTGWNEIGRVHSIILHAHITDSKIWIEHDGTPPPGLASYLLNEGVPPTAIVLAFYHPSKRRDTAFAVA